MNLLGKRLVIFGCGYIGGCVARQALAEGMVVTALTRNRATAETLRAAGARVVVENLASGAWHEHIPGGADYVLNSVSSGGAGIAGYQASYVGGMESILQWRRTAPVGTFVYTSSTSVYPQDAGVTVTEEAPTASASERGQLLLSAESLVRDTTGVVTDQSRSIILRLAGIYGPERHHLVDQVRAGSVAGRADVHLNLTHRDDVCAAIWAAFRAPPDVHDTVFNVVDNRPTRKGEVVNWLANELGVAPPTFTGAPVGGRRTLTPDRIILNRRLKQVLGWQPQFADFRAGYKNVLAVRTD